MSLSNGLGLLGRKVGMMRIFTDDGDAVPVTVLDVSNNRVTQVKTQRPTATAPCRWRSATPKRRASPSRWPGTSPRRVSRPAKSCRNSASTAESPAQVPGWRRSCRSTLFAVGPEGRRARHDHRQGLRGRHQAPQLQLAARVARQLPFAQRAGLDRRWRRIRAACFRASACPVTWATITVHDPEPRRRARRRSAWPAAGQGCGARAAEGGHVVVRPAVKAQGSKGARLMQLELLNDQGQADRQGRRARHHRSVASTTKR